MARDAAHFHPDLVDRRSQVMQAVDPVMVTTMDGDQLLALQSRMGYGEQWGLWEVPAEWMPASHRRPGERMQTLSRVLPEGMRADDPRAKRAWTELLRFGLLRSLVPAKIKGIPKPGTVVGEIYYAARVIQMFLGRSQVEGAFWSLVTEEEIRERIKTSGQVICVTLRYLHAMGYLVDAPRSSNAHTRGIATERNRKGREAPTQAATAAKQWQPLPDEFTSECGWRVLWMIKQLGPTLLAALEASLDVTLPRPGRGVRVRGQYSDFTRARKTVAERDKVIANWSWKTPVGEAINELPFEFRATRKRDAPRAHLGGQDSDFCWPPKSFGEAIMLLYILQGAHAFLLFLSAGPRASEVLSYAESCLVEVAGGQRVVGRTFKLERKVGGRKRDFPAPAIVIQAARQQVRLARFVKKVVAPQAPDSLGDHLWVQVTRRGMSSQGAVLHDMNSIFDSMVERLNLRGLLSEANPNLHTHRFRKTLARLVALALTNAQMILMDCFGHEDPEMTLQRYILSDPLIRADVIRIQRELVILMAVDAINGAETLGGPAGERVRRAKAAYMLQSNKNHLEPKDVYELAESLTRAGREWVVVTPGVICSLPTGFTGPCARHQGGRNPAYCRSDCEHQLLTAYNKTETDDMIAYILEHVQAAIDDEAPMMLSLWVGQLKGWLYRWREVYDKWSSHPLVKAHAEEWSVRREVLA